MSSYCEFEIMEKALDVMKTEKRVTSKRLIEKLNEVMNPSGQDKEPLFNRNDFKFDQKVRNMISNRENNKFLDYFDYFIAGNTGIITLRE